MPPKKSRNQILRRDSKQNLADNIRYLISCLPSIADASKQIGINRQQLNKYLNGSSSPSLRTMHRIASYFELPTEALTQDPGRLIKTFEKKPAFAQTIPEQSPVHEFQDTLRLSAEALNSYCGRYFRYHFIPEMPGQVLRSYAIISRQNDITQALVIERFATPNMPWVRRDIRRTRHLLSYVQDRIQFIEYGPPNEDAAPGFSLFYPVYASGVRYLSGILLGSFCFGTRPIYTSNIVMQRPNILRPLHKDLASCGIIPLDDPALEPEVIEHLCLANRNPEFHVAG